MELIFASNNKHKLDEVRALLAGKNYRIISLGEAGCHDEIPEEQPDLLGNALQKARYVYHKYQQNCFADDTGLEIDALDGRPGVYSARYAGEHCSFEDNMNKVLQEMETVSDRKACFKTVIALILDGKEYIFEGKVNGMILTEKHGEEGFGYDPIFRPEGFSTSFAQMTLEEKNSISHRGRALANLTDFLNTLINT
ncbi:MAG: non-canonical purine NTP diphosphatase [Bacteroidales bacterium]|jgi:XTP/dITP diphosphohydrolase|nr:non-canonical purine NTP diphosphatase [Bacteroidales bacterium]